MLKLLGMLTLLFAVVLPVQAEGVSPERRVEDDPQICNPIRSNKFKDFVANLKKHYNTTLKDSYHSIRCDDKDVMGLVIDGAADRYFTSIHLQKYYEKDEGVPYEFSKVLMAKINGQTVVRRIEMQLEVLRKHSKSSPSIPKLEKMLKKYKTYLKTYPVPAN